MNMTEQNKRPYQKSRNNNGKNHIMVKTLTPVSLAHQEATRVKVSTYVLAKTSR